MSAAFTPGKIIFAHAAYRLGEEFARRDTGVAFEEVRSLEALREAAPRAHVLVASGLWRNDMLGAAGKLRFIQSVSTGVDNFDQPALVQARVRLASAAGANAGAVAEHAIAMMLALSRQLHLARDRQAKREWRGMIADPLAREQEIGGKTLLVVGLGRIGTRLARLADAFGMRVIGVKRDVRTPVAGVAALFAPADLHRALEQADHVALTCPLTRETANLVDAAALAAMKPSAMLFNLARGKVVDEAALVDALGAGRIAGAGLDCFHAEPLPPASPLWGFPNVLVTPHSAGETGASEARIVDILCDNLARLARGEAGLRNEVV